MKKLLSAFFIACLIAAPAFAQEKPPIKIGYINAYTGGNYFVHPNLQGIQLAVEEINAKGGVLGRKLEVLSRDSKMDPAEATRIAEELYTRDKVDVLMNADASGTSLAVAGWAAHNHVPFFVTASEADTIIWKDFNPYLLRLNPGGYAWVSGCLEKASALYGDRLKNKRWVTLAPNMEFGRSIVQAGKDIAQQRGLNAQWVGEQWPAYDKLSAGATIAALDHADPEVVFVALFGTDVLKFVREARKRDFIKDRIFIFPPLAAPEHLDMLGAETPKGWVTVGFPYDEVRTKKPTLDSFMQRYEGRFHEPVKSYSVTGYDGIKAIAAAIEKAGGTDPEKIRASFDSLRFDTPYGTETVRSIDHQATVTFWVGVSDVVNGKPKISDWGEDNIADHSPPDAWIQKKRGQP